MDEKLGYVFHPSAALDGLGHDRFEFYLYDIPTGQHFDPESARLTIVTREGGVDDVRVDHPWYGPRTLRVCPGDVILEDLIGKKVEAFTFGGDLAIDVRDDLTACLLTSTAPILHPVAHPESEQGEAASLFAAEFEVILARRLAHWAGDPDEFCDRLATVDPAALYDASLVAVERRIRQIPPHRRRGRHRMMLGILDDTIEALRTHRPWPPPPLDDLL